MGGGLTFKNYEDNIIAIDLQDLNLDQITVESSTVNIGAATPLEKVKSFLTRYHGLNKAMAIEASKNIRNVGTIGGLVMSKNSRSPFLNCLNSMRTKIFFEPGNIHVELDDFIRGKNHDNLLVRTLSLHLPKEIIFDFVSRSPLDIPIISVAISVYEDERRISCNGFRNGPFLFSFNSSEKINIKHIVTQIDISDDIWASAAYKKMALEMLISRNAKEY